MANAKKGTILAVLSLVLILILSACGGNGDAQEVGSDSSLDYDSLEGEFDVLKKLQINGVDQWVRISGRDRENPILLVLHGGPGFVMMPVFDGKNKSLEEDFTIVHWDQRGAGKSYDENIAEKSMTLEQLVEDANKLTKYIKTEFKQEKIYVIGHSFGSVVGIELVHKYPQDYKAYIGTGQVVDFVRNEQTSYDFAYEMAVEYANEEALEILERIGRPDENGRYLNESGYEKVSGLVELYGGDLSGKTSIDEIYDLIFESDIYKDDHQKILDGYEFSQLLFEDEKVLDMDLMRDRSQLEVPVYFMLGRNDYDTPSKLAEMYFDEIEAPHKELIWFEESAHFPFYEEPEKFNRLMKIKFSN